MTTRLASSFPIAPAVLVLVSACGHHGTATPPPSAAPVAPVEPATASRPSPTPSHELAKPPADPAPTKEPAQAATEPPPKDVVGKIQANLAKARRGRALTDITVIESALENYAINNSGRYPDSLEPLITPDLNGATYMKAQVLPKDPWDRDYVYEPPSPGNPVPKIYTLGRDGRAGGTGEDADVDNISIRDEAPR